MRAESIDAVARTIEGMNLADAHPRLPDDMATALKFSICLTNSVAAAVLMARITVPDAIVEIFSRPIRQHRA
jgi:hypothetical protein